MWRVLKKRTVFLLVAAILLNSIQIIATNDDIYNLFKADEASIEAIQTKYNVDFDKNANDIKISDECAGLYSKTARMTIYAPKYNDDGSVKRNVESNFRIYIGSKAVPVPIDVSSYSYINMLVYSEKVPQQSDYPILDLGAYYQGNDSIQKYGSGGGIQVDFQGWKLISLPMNGFGSMDWSKLERIRFSTNVFHKPNSEKSGNAWYEKTFINFDRIWFSKYAVSAPELCASYPAENASISVIKPHIYLSFSNKLQEISADMLSLSTGGNECSADFVVRTNENTADIIINETLLKNTEYTLKLSGIKDEFNQAAENDITYSFKTYDHTFAAGEITAAADDGTQIFNIPEEGDMTFSAFVKNMGDSEISPIINVLIFESNGTLKEIVKGNLAEEPVIKPGYGGAVELKTEHLKLQNAGCIKVFVCASQDSMQMTDQRYKTFFKSEKPSIQMTDKKAESNVQLFADEPLIDIDGTLTLSGKTNIPLGNIMQRFLKDDGSICYISPQTAGEDGSFHVKFPMNAGSGWYSYTAEYDGCVTEEKKLYFISDAEKERILGRLNSAKAAVTTQSVSAEETAEGIMREYPYEFRLQSRSDNMIEDLAQYIYEKKPYQAYSGITLRTNQYDKITDSLKTIIWSKLDEFLTDNWGNVFYDTTYYDYYKTLDPSERMRVCEKLNPVLPIETIVKFRKDFDDCVKKYKEDKETERPPTPKPSPGTGGGGGGGTYKVDKNIIKEAGETTGMGEIGRFNDMQGFEWASEAVNALLKAKIISPSENNAYRPADNVKREEFTKLIVCLLGIEASGNISFSDVPDCVWYEKYLSAAVNNGIIYGMTDGSFGVGKPIIRQDAAVIIERALSKRNYTGSGEKKQFADSAEISDYARASVERLSADGLFNGSDNGNFMPQSTLTRAEAAQVIYNVQKFIARGEGSVEGN